jgi:hypothetical protein
VAAEPVASSWPVRAEGLRLVRSGSAELALQFELVNRTSDTYSGEDLGLGPVEQLVMLADLPRGTGYAPLTARYSASAADQIPVGGSTTVTVVFPAPPAETTSMLFVMNGLLPVRVPVQPPGAAALREDPVLHAAATPEEFPKVAPLICGSGPGAGSAAVPTRYRLPGDVLFAFGSAQLTPAAHSPSSAPPRYATPSPRNWVPGSATAPRGSGRPGRSHRTPGPTAAVTTRTGGPRTAASS